MVPMLRPENFFLPTFSSGSDTRVLNSAKSCLFSIVLTASLPAVTAAAKRYNFHSDAMHSQKKREKLPSRSLNESGKPGLCQGADWFFPVKKNSLMVIGWCVAVRPGNVPAVAGAPGSPMGVQGSAPGSQMVGSMGLHTLPSGGQRHPAVTDH